MSKMQITNYIAEINQQIIITFLFLTKKPSSTVLTIININIMENNNLHAFAMKEGFLHEDEGTAFSSAASVISVMENAKT